MKKVLFLIVISFTNFQIFALDIGELIELSNQTSVNKFEDNITSRNKITSRLVECRKSKKRSEHLPGDPRLNIGKIELKTYLFDFDNMKAYYLFRIDEKRDFSVFNYKIRKSDVIRQHYNPNQEIFYITEENDIFINFRTIFDFTYDKRTLTLHRTGYQGTYREDLDPPKCRYLVK
tara:strand:+ start:1491 stop:2018 length:528 start_codon:yes stop_codon:yes gene_type:complete